MSSKSHKIPRQLLQKQTQNFEGARLGNGYTIGPPLPRGHLQDAYCLKYLGFPSTQLVKVERRSKFTESALTHERDVYAKLSAGGFTPGILPFVKLMETNALRALVLPNVGRSIAHLLRQLFHFSAASVHKLAVNCVTALECLHSAGYVHGAVCTELLHVASDVRVDDSIYLTDFSHASCWGEGSAVEEDRKPVYEFSGSLAFASVRAHQGAELSREDDLVSLGYVLVSCYSGALPWFNELSNVLGKRVDRATVLGMKKKISVSSLCSGLPPPMKSFFRHLEGLAFDACPDYDFLRSVFLDELPDGVDQVVYDWSPN